MFPSSAARRAAVTAARERIAPHVVRTPLLRSVALGERLGCELWLKPELFQRTGSYKPRGILNRMMSVAPEVLARGVVTVSAGNAAAAVAYAAQRLGCAAVTCMPANASPAKVAATKAYGAEVILHGTSPEAYALALRLEKERNLTFIAPSDHPEVITGHASIGLEILEELPDADLILVPVGCGGLGAGVATGVAAAGSSARVVGVEPEGANTMWLSFEAGKPTDLPGPPRTVADGLAYPFGGQHTYPVFRELAERVVLVSDERILEATWLVMERAKLYAEPSGAAGVAGLMEHRAALAPFRKVVCVISGGNFDLQRFAALLKQ